MLPAAPDPVDKPSKYVDSGLEEMVDAMAGRGASPGTSRPNSSGSSMLDISVGEAVGQRNVDAANRALDAANVQLLAAETGGNDGRSVSFVPPAATSPSTVSTPRWK